MRTDSSESGAIRATVDYLDGAPAPKHRDCCDLPLSQRHERQRQPARPARGWAGVAPQIGELRAYGCGTPRDGEGVGRIVITKRNNNGAAAAAIMYAHYGKC